MNKSQTLLVLCALFLGASGPLTQIALQSTSIAMLIALRFLLAAFIGIIVFKINKFDKNHVKHSFILSIILLITYVAGVTGLKYTSASNAGFIVGSNVIIVPFLNWIIYKSKVTKEDYIRSSICFIGLAFVTLKGASPINIGDFYCFINAFAYSVYIIYNSRLDQNLDIKKLITFEYIFVGIFALIYVISFEEMVVHLDFKNILSITLLSVFCTFLAFYLQVIAQRKVSSEKASQILSLMPIFTVIFDIFKIKKFPTLYSIIGGIMIIVVTMGVEESFMFKYLKNKILYQRKEEQKTKYTYYNKTY